jgi:hypothetical protein
MRRLVPQTTHGRTAAVSMAIAAALPAGAVAKTETGANISLSTAVASNPFLSTLATTGDPESVSASIGISPWITFTEAETRLRIAGEARITEYAKTFPRSESFRLSADGTWQLDPRLKLSSTISYSESIVGETNLIGNTELGGSLPGENTTPVVIVDDPTLVGLRSRRRSFNTSLNAQYRPDGRQILQPGIGQRLCDLRRDGQLRPRAAARHFRGIAQLAAIRMPLVPGVFAGRRVAPADRIDPVERAVDTVGIGGHILFDAPTADVGEQHTDAIGQREHLSQGREN